MRRILNRYRAKHRIAAALAAAAVALSILPGCERIYYTAPTDANHPLYIGLFEAERPIWRWDPQKGDPVALDVLAGQREVVDILPLLLYTVNRVTEELVNSTFRIYAISFSSPKVSVVTGGNGTTPAKLETTIDLPAACQASALEASEFFQRIFIGCQNGLILKLNPYDHKIEGQLQLPNFGFLSDMLAASENLYVVDHGTDGGVVIVDGREMKLLKTVKVGQGPVQIGDGGVEVVVTNRGSGSVSMIHKVNHVVSGEITGLKNASAITDNGATYVTAVDNDSRNPTAIYVLDIVGRRLLQTITKPSPGQNPWSITASTGMFPTRVIVGNQWSSTLTYFDKPFPEKEQPTTVIVGGQPAAVVYPTLFQSLQ